MRIGVLLEDLEVRIVLAAQSGHNAAVSQSASTLTSSLRQNAQIDFGLACLTGVPFGLMAMRVPAASAFLCSFLMRSFLVIGISAAVDRDVGTVLRESSTVAIFGRWRWEHGGRVVAREERRWQIADFSMKIIHCLRGGAEKFSAVTVTCKSRRNSSPG